MKKTGSASPSQENAFVNDEEAMNFKVLAANGGWG